MCDTQVYFTHYTYESFSQHFFLTVLSVTGATEQTHKFMGFWQLVSTNGSAYGVVAGGV